MTPTNLNDMKIFQALLLTILCSVNNDDATAQGTMSPITIFPDQVMMDKVARPSIAMIIDAEADAFIKEWRNYLRKTQGMKTRERRGVISAAQASFPAISDKALDFYTLVNNHDVGIRVDVVVALGNDVYLSNQSYPDSYRKMEQILNEFSRDFLRARYSKIIQDKEKAIKSLEKDFSRETKNISKLESAIEKDSQEVDKLLKRLESNKEKLGEGSRGLPEKEQLLRLKKQRLLELRRGLQQVQ
jgi:predicted RNase H-like nuclease (RuvC/YqgF family)